MKDNFFYGRGFSYGKNVFWKGGEIKINYGIIYRFYNYNI